MTNSVKICIQLLLLVCPQWLEFHLRRGEIAKQAVHFYTDENAEKTVIAFQKGKRRGKKKKSRIY